MRAGGGARSLFFFFFPGSFFSLPFPPSARAEGDRTEAVCFGGGGGEVVVGFFLGGGNAREAGIARGGLAEGEGEGGEGTRYRGMEMAMRNGRLETFAAGDGRSMLNAHRIASHRRAQYVEQSRVEQSARFGPCLGLDYSKGGAYRNDIASSRQSVK